MMDNKAKELILKYFDAFAFLYSIISMKRALRIIKKHNPELNITEADFCEFIDNYDFSDKYYIIEYDDVVFSYEPSKETDPLKKYLIADFLHAIDDWVYDEMKDTQTGLRFYVPEKEELLKYSDEFYYEKNVSQQNMKNFLQKELHVSSDVAEELIEEWIAGWKALTENDVDIEFSINELRRLSKGKFKNFKNLNQVKKFTSLYADMFNHTRLPMFRGFTPIEVNRKKLPEVYENY